MHPPLDEAELHEGQRDHHDHQDHGLGRRAAEVLAAQAMTVDAPSPVTAPVADVPSAAAVTPIEMSPEEAAAAEAAREAERARAVRDAVIASPSQAEAARRLIDALESSAPPRTREDELRKARERTARRFPAATH